MMHGGPSLTMWVMMALYILLPVLAVALAAYAIVRSRRAGAPPAAHARPSPAAQARAPEDAAALSAAELRLLDEDERRLYELVLERDGEAPQSDLVTLSGFSKAKVSRVLDRLESKGVVVRLRRGMGNLVVLAPRETAA